MSPSPTSRPPRQRTLSVSPAGIIATIVLAVVVIVFVRLGFWQLSRLAEVREENRAIAARLDAPPLSGAVALRDTSGLFYRAVEVEGSFDNDRSIVLPGRSRRSIPGVHVITPMLLEDGAGTVLVNRGWVPSADAASVDYAAIEVVGPVRMRALVLPFPDVTESLAPRATPPSDGFRRVWYHIDEAELRAQYPYPLLDVMLQALPDSTRAIAGSAADTAPRYPQRLEPPPLTEGSHLGYALQWFSFAIIGVIGWIAMVLRSRDSRTRSAPPAALILVTLLPLSAHALLPASASAQLRPLDPPDWRVFDAPATARMEVGVGVFRDHAAPLAGTRGSLIEAGNYMIAVRSGRIALEIRGTALWRLHEERRVLDPEPVVDPAPDGVRREVGTLQASSSMRVSPDRWPLDVFVRFGATIPTTSDESGLERDRTDVFALAGFRYRAGALTLTTEQGVGINGSHSHRYPQTDMWTFNVGAAYQLSALRLAAELVGRQDGHTYVVRGNEDQHELRLGADFGERRWIAVRYVAGLSQYSPDAGLRIGVGLALPIE